MKPMWQEHFTKTPWQLHNYFVIHVKKYLFLQDGTQIHMFLLLRSPATSLGFVILDKILAYVTVFNRTIEVVTFRLRG